MSSYGVGGDLAFSPSFVRICNCSAKDLTWSSTHPPAL